MSAALLDKLDGVRRNGPTRWMARCPAHDDRNPSLAIRELDNGRTLFHCFAGCAVDEIVSALGMDLSDLFPPREDEGFRPERRPFFGDDMLRALSRDALLVAVAAEFVAQGKPLTGDDLEALNEAATRLRAGVVACGRRAA